MTLAHRRLTTVLWVAFAVVPVAGNDSLYTPIDRAACRAPAKDLAAAFEGRGVGVQQCPAPAGWRVFMVASDANTWIEVQSGTLTWSSEEAVVYDLPIGLFPSVAGSSRVEWRRDRRGHLTGLLFRVTARNPANERQAVTRIFVVRLEPARACLLGRAATNAEARRLADSARACPA